MVKASNPRLSIVLLINFSGNGGKTNRSSTLTFKTVVLFFVLLFYFIPLLTLHCQSLGKQQLSGIVIDEDSKEPLENCYFFLKNFPEFNWLSDQDGKFIIKYPETLNRDTLIISFIGYQRKAIALSSIQSRNLSLELKKSMILLDEVVIVPDRNLLEELLGNVVKNISTNYPDQRHQLSGIYRKISTDYEEYSGLVEAAVTIEDVGYDKDLGKSKIKLEAFRKGDELSEVDSVYVKYLDRLREEIQEKTGVKPVANALVDLYSQNPLRGAYLPGALFTEEELKMSFIGIPEYPVYHRIVDYELIETDTIYQIAFGSTDPPIGTSYIKINSRDFAVLELQFTMYSNEERTNYVQMFVKFKKQGAKYFPEKIVEKKMRFISRDVGGHRMDIHTFWFDEVKTGKLKKIPSNQAQKSDKDISDGQDEYNWDFWKQYELLKNHPLDSAILKSLERNRSLEEQFKRNGKD